MIVYEPNFKGNKKLVKIYSDIGSRIVQVDTGNIFQEYVVDSIDSKHVYEELFTRYNLLAPIPEELYEDEEDDLEREEEDESC